MKNSIKILIKISIGLVVISIHEYWEYALDKKMEKEYNVFYNSDLRGKIGSIGTIYHGFGTTITLKGKGYKYVFYPKEKGYSGERLRFPDFAKTGDSILKPAKKDTLYLFKRDLIYKYFFSKKP